MALLFLCLCFKSKELGKFIDSISEMEEVKCIPI